MCPTTGSVACAQVPRYQRPVIYLYTLLAQSVERTALNRVVISSSLIWSDVFFFGVRTLSRQAESCTWGT